MDAWYHTIVQSAPGYALRVLGAVGTFVAFWIAANVAARIIPALVQRASYGHEQVAKLLGSLAYAAVMVFGTVSALGTLGIDVTALVAGLGLTGFALGFALRDAISNALCGILILFYRPFRVGDRIAVAGADGLVQEVNLRYTIVDGTDRRFLVPNSKLFSETVTIQRR